MADFFSFTAAGRRISVNVNQIVAIEEAGEGRFELYCTEGKHYTISVENADRLGRSVHWIQERTSETGRI